MIDFRFIVVNDLCCHDDGTLLFIVRTIGKEKDKTGYKNVLTFKE